MVDVVDVKDLILGAVELRDFVDASSLDEAVITKDTIDDGDVCIVRLVDGDLLDSARNELVDADLRKPVE